MSDHPPPTDEDRRRAACLAMTSAPGLIRFAARFTRSLHDAEDAYQRAMEIALTKAPVVEPRRFMAWLHTVVRNEAIAIARARRRETTGVEADLAETGQIEDAIPLDAVTEWRERYRSIQDGLAGLTEAQRMCLMLRTAGASYSRIQEITGYSLRKVERSVLEGRANLAAFEVRLASGEACDRIDPLITRVAGGQATQKESRAVRRHVGHCLPCRALLRERRESNEWLAGLVPAGLLVGQAMAGAPDPTPVLAWWDRVAGGATVRMGAMVQMAMELPSAAIAKVGAGTAAVAIAGVAGAPMVVEAVAPEPGRTAPAAAVVSAPTPAPPLVAEDLGGADGAEELAEVFARAERVRAKAATSPRSRPRVRARTTRPAAPLPASAARATVSTSRRATPAPEPAAAPVAPSSQAVALEFGP